MCQIYIKSYEKVWKITKDPNQYPKQVTTMEGFEGNTNGGIKHQSLQQFLLS